MAHRARAGHLAVPLALTLALTLLAGEAAAQQCARDCPRAERDASGCCRARPAPPVTPAPAATRCGVNEHVSSGHCCRAGEEWVTARSQCVCLEAAVCGGTQAPATAPSAATPAATVVPAQDISGTWTGSWAPVWLFVQERTRVTLVWMLGTAGQRADGGAFTGEYQSPTVLVGSARRRNMSGCMWTERYTITVQSADTMALHWEVSEAGCGAALGSSGDFPLTRQR